MNKFMRWFNGEDFSTPEVVQATILPPTPEELYDRCQVKKPDLDFTLRRFIGMVGSVTGRIVPSAVVKITHYCPTVTDDPTIERPTATYTYDRDQWSGDRGAMIDDAEKRFAGFCVAVACNRCLFPEAKNAVDVAAVRAKHLEAERKAVEANIEVLRQRQILLGAQAEEARAQNVLHNVQNGGFQDTI